MRTLLFPLVVVVEDDPIGREMIFDGVAPDITTVCST